MRVHNGFYVTSIGTAGLGRRHQVVLAQTVFACLMLLLQISISLHFGLTFAQGQEQPSIELVRRAISGNSADREKLGDFECDFQLVRMDEHHRKVEENLSQIVSDHGELYIYDHGIRHIFGASHTFDAVIAFKYLFKNLPDLYNVKNVSSAELDGRHDYVISLLPKSDLLPSEGTPFEKVTLWIDKQDMRAARVVCVSKRVGNLTQTHIYRYSKTHGLWLMSQINEVSEWSFHFRHVQEDTQASFAYTKFGVSTKVLIPPQQ